MGEITNLNKLIFKYWSIVIFIFNFYDNFLGRKEERLCFVKRFDPKFEMRGRLEIKTLIDKNSSGVGINIKHAAEVAAGNAVADLFVVQ